MIDVLKMFSDSNPQSFGVSKQLSLNEFTLSDFGEKEQIKFNMNLQIEFLRQQQEKILKFNAIQKSLLLEQKNNPMNQLMNTGNSHVGINGDNNEYQDNEEQENFQSFKSYIKELREQNNIIDHSIGKNQKKQSQVFEEFQDDDFLSLYENKTKFSIDSRSVLTTRKVEIELKQQDYFSFKSSGIAIIY